MFSHLIILSHNPCKELVKLVARAILAYKFKLTNALKCNLIELYNAMKIDYVHET